MTTLEEHINQEVARQQAENAAKTGKPDQRTPDQVALDTIGPLLYLDWPSMLGHLHPQGGATWAARLKEARQAYRLAQSQRAGRRPHDGWGDPVDKVNSRPAEHQHRLDLGRPVEVKPFEFLHNDPADDPFVTWRHPDSLQVTEPGQPFGAPGASFQDQVAAWLTFTFSKDIATSPVERSHRFLEEALELVQARGMSLHEVVRAIVHVWSRDAGEHDQEVGGVLVTLAALCWQNGTDLDATAKDELARCWTKVEKIRAKQEAKPTFHVSAEDPVINHAVFTLTAAVLEAREMIVEPERIAVPADFGRRGHV